MSIWCTDGIKDKATAAYLKRAQHCQEALRDDKAEQQVCARSMAPCQHPQNAKVNSNKDTLQDMDSCNCLKQVKAEVSTTAPGKQMHIES